MEEITAADLRRIHSESCADADQVDPANPIDVAGQVKLYSDQVITAVGLAADVGLDVTIADDMASEVAAANSLATLAYYYCGYGGGRERHARGESHLANARGRLRTVAARLRVLMAGNTTSDDDAGAGGINRTVASNMRALLDTVPEGAL